MPWTHTFTQLQDEEQDGLGTVQSVFTDGVLPDFTFLSRVDMRDNPDVRRHAKEAIRQRDKFQAHQAKVTIALNKLTTAFGLEGE